MLIRLGKTIDSDQLKQQLTALFPISNSNPVNRVFEKIEEPEEPGLNPSTAGTKNLPKAYHNEERLEKIVLQIAKQTPNVISFNEAGIIINYLQDAINLLKITPTELAEIQADQPIAQPWLQKPLAEIAANVIEQQGTETYLNPQALVALHELAKDQKNIPVQINYYTVLAQLALSTHNYDETKAAILTLLDIDKGLVGKPHNKQIVMRLALISNLQSIYKQMQDQNINTNRLMDNFQDHLNSNRVFLQSYVTDLDDTPTTTQGLLSDPVSAETKLAIYNKHNELLKRNGFVYLPGNDVKPRSKIIIIGSIALLSLSLLALAAVLVASHGLAVPVIAAMGYALISTFAASTLITLLGVIAALSLFTLALEHAKPGYLKSWLSQLATNPFIYAHHKISHEKYRAWQKPFVYLGHASFTFAKLLAKGFASGVKAIVYAVFLWCTGLPQTLKPFSLRQSIKGVTDTYRKNISNNKHVWEKAISNGPFMASRQFKLAATQQQQLLEEERRQKTQLLEEKRQLESELNQARKELTAATANSAEILSRLAAKETNESPVGHSRPSQSSPIPPKSDDFLAEKRNTVRILNSRLDASREENELLVKENETYKNKLQSRDNLCKGLIQAKKELIEQVAKLEQQLKAATKGSATSKHFTSATTPATESGQINPFVQPTTQ